MPPAQAATGFEQRFPGIPVSSQNLRDGVTGLRDDNPPLTRGDDGVLDNVAWHSLVGPHAQLAEVAGHARRYPIDVSPFVALPDSATPRAWADLARLAGPGAVVTVTGQPSPAPASWEPVACIEGVQMVEVSVVPDLFPQALRLGPADVPDMLDLVARTQPGPFRPRAIELGTYLGVRDEGRLVAMAGQRLRPPGWIEVSAVCTDPAHRGRGLAGTLVRAIVADIRSQGSRALLQTSAQNAPAIRLYEQLGFELRRRTTFAVYRTPAQTSAGAGDGSAAG
jgi:ribosomal protein S18 acetylase RimI-like enzyme